MQELYKQIKLRKFDPSKFNGVESGVFFVGALIVPIVLSVGAAISVGSYFLKDSSTLKNPQYSAKISQAAVVEPQIISTVVPASTVATITPAISPVDDAPVTLVSDKQMTYSSLFLDGKSRLGPAGRKSADAIFSSMSSRDNVDLFGYAGLNKFNSKKFQTDLASARALSVKIHLSEKGIDPKNIYVINPSQYLFTEALPEDPKLVKSTIWNQQNPRTNPALGSLSDADLKKLKRK